MVRNSILFAPLSFMIFAAPAAAQTAAAAKTGAPAQRYEMQNGYSLAFVDADVRRVLDAVLGAMLGVDYSIDPAVTGTITLKTAKAVTKDQLLPLLEDALGSVNAAIVSRGGSYKVVPISAARQAAPLGGEGGSSAGFASEIVTLQYVSAREMGRLLEQFLGKDVVAGVDNPRSQVLISGSRSERDAAKALVARFDVDALAGMNYRIVKLETVDPDTVVDELGQIFKPPYDIIGSRVRIVPLPRMRSVLVIANNSSDFAKVEPWIHRLDTGSGGKPKLYSYMVQNGRARDLAAALQRVLGGSSAVSETISSTPEPISTSNEVSGGSGADKSPALPQRPAQTSLTEYDAGSGSLGPRIVPSDENNSLLIYATGEEYELVREVLDKIDRPVAQVLIEATLAEVTLNKDLDLGVDWSFLSGRSTFDLRNAATSAPAAIFPGFSYGYTTSDARIVLNTLQSRTDVKVLSAPRLIVLNNQTATLQVGDQVPIVTQQAQSVASAGAPIVNNIELRDTGVILKVTPRVNESGAVTLDIAQEVSDVAETTTSGINSPTIQQRRLSSTVTTYSGQMIALGGLIRERTTRQKSGIPFLSQIPVIGAAFGTQSTRAQRTELIILITPTVIRNPGEVKAIVDDVLQGLDQVRPIVEQSRRQPRSPATPPPFPPPPNVPRP